mgnify:CR=1 FL=1
MSYLYAAIPILLVLALMLFFKRGSHQAGFAGWLAGIVIAVLAFGLNWQVFWVSQVKGLLLTLNVLMLLWPSILMYFLVDEVGGIRAIANALSHVVPDTGWLVVVQAWMLSALVENLAGFGMPIAIVSPMLIALGVNPVKAVAASAMGHSWAVSTSGMGLSIRTLADVSATNVSEIFPTAAVLLGAAAILTGLGVSFVLGQPRQWWRVVILGTVVGLTQYGVGMLGLVQISSFIAAIVGVVVGILLCRCSTGTLKNIKVDGALRSGLLSYGILIAVVLFISLVKPLNGFLAQVTWTLQFPQVTSGTGLVTPAGGGYLFKPLVNAGTMILLSILLATIFLPRVNTYQRFDFKYALSAMLKSALPASVGTLFMIGLSTMMEHTGMTRLIAQGLSTYIGSVYPLVAPLVGMLGAFTTGSNTNSNVLFGLMQKNVANLLGINPVSLLAGQTTGGALGSMIAPAKLAVGCSTSEAKGQEGQVLRITLPIGLGIVLVIGLILLVLFV